MTTRNSNSNADFIIQNRLYNDLNMFAIKIIKSKNGQNRIKYWDHFEKLHEHFNYKKKYGRIHNLRLMCKLLVKLTKDMENAYYEDNDEIDEEEVGESRRPISLYEWDEGDYDKMRDYFLLIVNNLYREDATYSPMTDDNENNDLVEERDDVINRRKDLLLRYISVLRAVCPLQEYFLTLLNGQCTLSDDDILPVNKTTLREVWEAVQEGCDEQVKHSVSKLLRDHEDSNDDDNDGGDNIRLVKIGRLRAQLQEKPLSLGTFCDCINKTIRTWVDEFFIDDEDDEDDEEDEEEDDGDEGEKNTTRPDQMSVSREHVRRLRKVRTRLNNTGEDPLEESYAAAVSAVGAAAAPPPPPSAGTSISNDEDSTPKKRSMLSPAARKRKPQPLRLSSSHNKRKTPEQAIQEEEEEPTPESNAKVAIHKSNNGSSLSSKRRRRRFSNDGSRHSSPSTKRRLWPHKGYLLEPKKTAHRLEFGSGGEEDDDLSEDSRVDFGLSDLPSSERRRGIKRIKKPAPKTQKKKYDGRRSWNDQEKLAIKEGIKQYGRGKWKEILDAYKNILGDRTSAQIKDCARTMDKHGELEDVRS